MNRKKNIAERIQKLDVFLLLFLGCLAVITLFPFYQVALLSVSNMASYAKHPLYLLPYTVDFINYKTIFQDGNFLNALCVTLFVTIVGTSLNMVLSVCGAYALSRKSLIGREFFLNMIIFTMMFSGGMIPTYLNVKSLGLINTVWSMILPAGVNTFYLIIMKNYFVSLPDSLLEAARLDGAHDFTILRRIVLPISKPFIATFVLFYAVERWNEWYNCKLYVNEQRLYTLQIYLREILASVSKELSSQAQQIMQARSGVSSTALQNAAILVATIPILCVYPFLQKYFVHGIMVGSIKG